MDKLINDRKKQLLDMQQMLKMQDLLEEYDRENLFLNRQVDSLLKQNLMLKQKSLLPSASVNYLSSSYVSGFNSKGLNTSNEYSGRGYEEGKSYSYQKKKSRYQYMYDENEIRDLKANLKNEIKRDAMKNSRNTNANSNNLSKEAQGNYQYGQQTNIQEANIYIPSKINWAKPEPTISNSSSKKQQKLQFEKQQNVERQQKVERQARFGISKPQQTTNSSAEKFTPIKKPSVKKTQEFYFKDSMRQSQNHSPSDQLMKNSISKSNSMSKSKSKSKSNSKEKLEVSLKSKSSLTEHKPIQSTQAKTHSPKREQQQTSPKPQQYTVKQIQQGAQIFLQQSFGNKSAQRLQKKFTLIEADFTLGQSNHKQQQKPPLSINQSRTSNKFIPLSIQTNQPPLKQFKQVKQVSIKKESPKNQHNNDRQLLRVASRQMSQDISKQLSKDISIIMSKTQLQKPGISIYSQPALRSSSKQKRNHSLNPSPKIQYNPNQVSAQKIKPFIIQTDTAIPAPPSELNRNPSEKIKRKFIKIVSSQKISQQSPKKQKPT